MSASSKKKLRNEQNAAKLTERQLAEQKEAKKLKLMTVSFTAVLALILVVAIAFASVQFVNNSGIREKSTVAVTLGDAKLSNAQLNYYFVDAAFEFANTYGAYASMFGLNLNAPLNEQVINEETGGTWADDFTNSAISNAKSDVLSSENTNEVFCHIGSVIELECDAVSVGKVSNCTLCEVAYDDNGVVSACRSEALKMVAEYNLKSLEGIGIESVCILYSLEC